MQDPLGDSGSSKPSEGPKSFRRVSKVENQQTVPCSSKCCRGIRFFAVGKCNTCITWHETLGSPSLTLVSDESDDTFGMMIDFYSASHSVQPVVRAQFQASIWHGVRLI